MHAALEDTDKYQCILEAKDYYGFSDNISKVSQVS